MKRVIINIAILLFASSCNRSRRVQSSAFNLMLETLLSHSVNEISVDSLQKEKNNVILLDARSPQEYRVSHIDDARYVGYKNFDSTEVADIDKNAKIVVYCAVGYRSEKISEKLKQMGFTNVSNLYGGIFEWKNEGNKVVNQSGPTQQVHAYDKFWGVWLNKGKKVYK